MLGEKPVYLRSLCWDSNMLCLCALMQCVHEYAIVCMFVWGGFHLFMNQKELTADRRQDGLGSIYLEWCEDLGGKGLYQKLGTAGVALEEGLFQKSWCFMPCKSVLIHSKRMTSCESTHHQKCHGHSTSHLEPFSEERHCLLSDLAWPQAATSGTKGISWGT